MHAHDCFVISKQGFGVAFQGYSAPHATQFINDQAETVNTYG
ncbi:hypothetical protein [Tateyamaria sp.]